MSRGEARYGHGRAGRALCLCGGSRSVSGDGGLAGDRLDYLEGLLCG